jgi:tripartite-type tricarboxylate transporter receptor subunit TctC
MIAYKKSATWFAAAFFLSIAAADSSAQEFPTRPVKIMVPSPPGSGTDILARLLADLLSRTWQSPVVVENGSGVATGNVAAAEVSRSAPDGYTLLLCPPGPISTNALLYKKLNYDPQKWVVISHLATVPYVLALRKNFEASTVQGKRKAEDDHFRLRRSGVERDSGCGQSRADGGNSIRDRSLSRTWAGHE